MPSATPIAPAALLDDLLKAALKAGADAVDILHMQEESQSVRVRHGKVDSVTASEAAQLGLRLFIGKQQAMVASTDFSDTALAELVSRAVSMARLSPEDPYCGLAAPDEIVTHPPTLDIFDAGRPTTDALVKQTLAMEAAALKVAGVTNTDEAEGGWGSTSVHIRQSNGFAGNYRRSSHGLSVSVIAGKDTAMERDYDYTSAVYAADMLPPETVGKRAGERAIKRLGARKMPTGKYPIVFEPRVAASFIGHFASAINGSAICRGTSFLQNAMGQKIFPAGFTVTDNPHRARGMRSRPFDAEGIATTPKQLIDDGVLTTWLLDLRAARQLGMKSTGHAGRGASSPPGASPSNIAIGAGKLSPQELIQDIKQGFYVTELIGMGVNGVTGDYSRGAAGFWIENGVIAHPVNEMTIAGNLKEMFAAMTAANDLALRLDRESPTLRIEGMTVAGL
ncbi:MAG: TldD/PmbA family protein [Alphaproteobacteria bacterium]|nr:TldD/PmbA family protein [Alphaproteobacteria bacterium]